MSETMFLLVNGFEPHAMLVFFGRISQQQPHYNLWADFKAKGGVIESVSYKTDGEFLT